MVFSLIVIQDIAGGIGNKNGTIPHKNTNDMANFTNLTKGNVVIMGGSTFRSIGRPLSDRYNIIITNSNDIKETDNCFVVHSIDECLQKTELFNKLEIFVIGGAKIYKLFLDLDLISYLYISTAQTNFRCEIKMPEIDFSKFFLKNTKDYKGKINDRRIEYEEYAYKNYEEQAVLNLIKEVMNYGTEKPSRTMIDIKSLFGRMLSFNLLDGKFPLGTTKRVPLYKVFSELMWIIRGQTDTKILHKKGIYVWDANSSREFLDSRGLFNYKEGDIGPSYGFSMRHYGAEYKGCNHDYTGQGYDQLANAIDLIINDYSSRRIIINLWNPAVIDKVALPPCLYSYQFYVEIALDSKYLSCIMDQRSSDISLAGFWNIATGALLTYMLASVTGCKPKSLHWRLGDIHIYKNQHNDVKKLLIREPKMFPRLSFLPTAPSFENKKDITEFEYNDMVLSFYTPHEAIKGVLNP